jgi:hypothetical protein
MYTIKVIITKPSNEVWFNESNPNENLIISNWMENQPGFISIERELDGDKLIQKINFDTYENYMLMINNQNKPDAWNVRKQNFIDRQYEAYYLAQKTSI